MKTRSSAFMLGVAVLTLAACGGREKRGDTTGAGGAPAGTTPATGGASAGTPATGAPASASSITPQMVAEGDSIFHGQKAGGLCFSCHGPDGKGTATGPSLAGPTWLQSDGSYESMVRIVTNGVPTPKKFPAPMPPMGGAQLTPDQIRAVAAYEYSLGHKL